MNEQSAEGWALVCEQLSKGGVHPDLYGWALIVGAVVLTVVFVRRLCHTKFRSAKDFFAAVLLAVVLVGGILLAGAAINAQCPIDQQTQQQAEDQE